MSAGCRQRRRPQALTVRDRANLVFSACGEGLELARVELSSAACACS